MGVPCISVRADATFYGMYQDVLVFATKYMVDIPYPTLLFPLPLTTLDKADQGCNYIDIVQFIVLHFMSFLKHWFLLTPGVSSPSPSSLPQDMTQLSVHLKNFLKSKDCGFSIFIPCIDASTWPRALVAKFTVYSSAS